jgi:hypothetical protein
MDWIMFMIRTLLSRNYTTDYRLKIGPVAKSTTFLSMVNFINVTTLATLNHY